MLMLYLPYLLSNDHLGISVSKSLQYVCIPALMISLTLTKSKLAKDFADLEITLLVFKDETPESRESEAYTPEASIQGKCSSEHGVISINGRISRMLRNF